MADCNETLEELHRYLDQELPSARVNDILAHLKSCTDCQGTFEFHAEYRRVIREKALREEISPDFEQRLKSCFGDDVMGRGDGTSVPG